MFEGNPSRTESVEKKSESVSAAAYLETNRQIHDKNKKRDMIKKLNPRFTLNFYATKDIKREGQRKIARSYPNPHAAIKAPPIAE